MDLYVVLALLVLVAVLNLYIGNRWGHVMAQRAVADERRDYQERLAGAEVLLAEKAQYIEGLWSPKDCPVHVFSREPALRKNGQLKFLCQRCGEVRWTTKAS